MTIGLSETTMLTERRVKTTVMFYTTERDAPHVPRQRQNRTSETLRYRKHHTSQFHQGLHHSCVTLIRVYPLMLERIPSAEVKPTDNRLLPRQLNEQPPLSSSYQTLPTTSWLQALGSWWKWTRQRPVFPCRLPPLHWSPSTEGCRCPSPPWREGGSRCG